LNIVDLSHVIASAMPVYPGTPSPVIKTAFCISENGFSEKQITLCSHTGTHIDAPAHMLEGGKTLDQLPIDRYSGRAFVFDAAAIQKSCIDVQDLAPCRKALEVSDFMLLHTGWSRFWSDRKYFKGYPVLTEKAAAWLGGFGLKGIGVDAISADRDDSVDYPVHKLLFGRGMIVIENLTGLKELLNRSFIFFCFPLKIEQAEGSPVRAAALI
jgi:kynurenine formamidase